MSRTQTITTPHHVDVSLHARNKKSTMAVGGRAWREDEEAYLLRTRLQKTPYKQIAAHLNKTELACRLHYHQLSHGSSRRKRAASASSGSDRSPIMSTMASTAASHGIVNPMYGRDRRRSSRSISPPRLFDAPRRHLLSSPPPHNHYHHQHQHQHQHSHQHHQSRHNDVQLPSIMATAPGCSSPRVVPTILPRPASMDDGYSPRRATSPLDRYSNQQQQPPAGAQHEQPPLPPMSLRRDLPPLPLGPSPVRVLPDRTSGLPTPSTPASSLQQQQQQQHSPAHVNLNRLNAVYAAHRDRFWDLVAAEYGSSGLSPATLERAWKTGRCCGSTPDVLSPLASPREERAQAEEERKRNSRWSMSPPDKTRISCLISAN